MKRIVIAVELTDGQYDVLQRLSSLEKQDHASYVQDALVSFMESDIDVYFTHNHPEHQELVDKLGLEAARKAKMEAGE